MKTPHEHLGHGTGDFSADPRLDALAARLDALGASDASAAPDGLEDRVLGGVGRVFAPEPIAIDRARPTWWRGGTVRTAAGVVIVAGIGIVAYLQNPGGPGRAGQPGGAEIVSVAMVEQRIDALLALASDSGDDFGNQVASIELWADALGSETGTSWGGAGGTDLDNSGIRNGAM